MALEVPRCVRGPKCQKYLTLLLVCISLFINNGLYSSLLYILPIQLDRSNASDLEIAFNRTENMLPQLKNTADPMFYFLLCQKPIAQFILNFISGILMDKIGYKIFYVTGETIMIIASICLAFSPSFWCFFAARSLQGICAAFADTAAFATIADKYFNHTERTVSIAVAFICASLGWLLAPLIIGRLYYLLNSWEVLQLLLAIPSLCCAVLFLVLIRKQFISAGTYERSRATVVCRLLRDRHISVCGFALVCSRLFPALVEPLLPVWLVERFGVQQIQIWITWPVVVFPLLLSAIVAVVFVSKWAKKFSAMVLVGLVFQGIFMVPFRFSHSFWQLLSMLCIVMTGYFLIVVTLLPMLTNLIDMRHQPVYGSIFAFVGICDAVAQCLGFGIAAFARPEFFDFIWLIAAIFSLTVVSFLLFWFLRPIYRPPAPMEESFVMVHQSL